jgi:hypothetical protein
MAAGSRSHRQESAQVESSLAVLHAACKAVLASEALPMLLQLVLQIGNRMNAGTRLGKADAFKLDRPVSPSPPALLRLALAR